MPLIDCGGRAVYAERHGPDDSTALPLLLLHGAGSNAATWWQQLPAFSAHRPVVTMDLRCFARSAAPLDEFLYAHFVSDALRVLDHFGLPRAIVVGQSLGGMVGLRLALQHADRVAAFVACDSPLGVDHPLILAALQAQVRDAPLQGLEQRTLGAWFRQRHPDRVALYAQIHHFNPATHSLPAADWHAALGRLMSADNLLPMAALAGLRCPVLWLVGREDPLVPLAALQDAQAMTPGSELAVVDDCGHSTYFEKPEVFNPLVLDFIARRASG